MRIQLHSPRTALAPFVEYIWTLESAAGSTIAFPRIPPFGEVELAFHFDDPFAYRGPDQSPQSVGAAHVSGPRRRWFELLPGRRVGFLSVRFRPGAFYFFHGGSLAELTDQVVDPRELSGPDYRWALDRIRAAETAAERIHIVEEYLLECLGARGDSDPFVPAAMNVLHASLKMDSTTVGGSRTDFMADELGLSRRSFQRKFRDAFGMSARDYHRLLRFENTLKDTLRLRARAETVDLGEQALRFGYFDQSHFNKDFREFMGLSPSEFLRIHGEGIGGII